MKSHPILFSAPMVRALIAGTKTQTRRLVKPQPGSQVAPWSRDGLWKWLISETGHSAGEWFKCPYGVPGDLLWVKEAWFVSSSYDTWPPRHIPADVSVEYVNAVDGGLLMGRYRHARFMPRWASRITLRVTDVCVQRLGEISEGDAMAEGYPGFLECGLDPHGWYRRLWDELHGAGSYKTYPWVFALTFERIKP